MTISEQLANAKTPGQKAVVSRKMNAIAEYMQQTQGKDPKMVIAGFKAAAKRISNRAG